MPKRGNKGVKDTLEVTIRMIHEEENISFLLLFLGGRGGVWNKR
jgi:hypothetical protein